MFHVGFIRTVLRVLRCVSYHNSKLLLEPVSTPYRLSLCSAVTPIPTFNDRRAMQSARCRLI